MSSGAIIVRRQNSYMRAFRKAGALSPDTAQTLDALGLSESWIFDRMVKRGVFVPAGDGRWHINEFAASALIRRRYFKIAIILALAVIAWLVAIALSR